MELEKPKPKQKRKKERTEPINIVNPPKYDDPISNLSESADIARELQIAAQESFDEKKIENIPSSSSDCLDIEKISLGGSLKSLDFQSISNFSENSTGNFGESLDTDNIGISENASFKNDSANESEVILLERETNDDQSVGAEEEHIHILENRVEAEDDTHNKLLLENKKIVSDLLIEAKETDMERTYIGFNVKSGETSKECETSTSENYVIHQPVIRPFTENQLKALYINQELDLAEKFSEQFVEAELKGLGAKNHPLYELLNNYLTAKSKVIGNNIELEQLKKDYKDTLPGLWSLDNAVLSANGVCQDGNKVTAYQSYNKANFHRSAFQTITRILSKIKELSFEGHVLYSYSSEVYRLRIELYLENVIENCLSASQIPRNAGVNLTLQSPPPYILCYLSELRLCISVLFGFQRRLIKDVDFIKKSRAWLSKLVAVFLRLANWQDHLFLLNHVLRCPPSVGSWATPFIQAPLKENFNKDSPFSSFEVNHVVAVLSILMMPIKEREKFLNDLSQTQDNPGEPLWVVVDSEGEEDEDTSGTSLRENDLVSLLNQLPFNQLFRNALLIETRNNDLSYNTDLISDNHVLKTLAFSTVLLKILTKGLITYDQQKYNQFSKRICRIIRHIVQYATDQWEIYMKRLRDTEHQDSAMLKRLQVEYDAFFLRATHSLYSSKKLAAWQFLAVIPYATVSLDTIYSIYYMLQNPCCSFDEILESQTSSRRTANLQFEDVIARLEDGEIYYLFNTIANMALARSGEEIDFIQLATLDLLRIGFLSETTRENCAKNVRILLTHITSKFPSLLSDVFEFVSDNLVQIGELSLYLYEELPLAIWRPTIPDLEIITKFLTTKTTSYDSSLARMIISRLNWSLTEDDHLPFLPFEIHCKIAILVLKAVEFDIGYEHFAWQTFFRLRLHVIDRGSLDFTDIKDPTHFDAIIKGLRINQSLASFLALLLTSYGHLVPVICSKGLPLLRGLIQEGKFEAVIFALNSIVPLFLECQEALINNEDFQFVLQGLLNADRGYVNMAKSLVVSQNFILESFANMVETQICGFTWYKQSSPRCLVRLWVNSLVSLPNWNKDFGVMHLLDVVVRDAFFYPDAIDVASDILKELLQCISPQEQSNTISSLFKWVSQSNTQGNLLINSSLSSYSWLAYVMINLEYEEREKQTGLWREVLLQLRNQKGKVNVDSAIKKAASSLKVPSFSSSGLCIFRWAQQALDTPLDHPILALLWQKFFSLYLCRVPTAGVTDVGCIGSKFFEGLINLTFMKRLKKRLLETVDYFRKKVEDDNMGVSQQTKLYYQTTFKLYEAFTLWLEEPRLQEAGLFLPGLPQSYQPQLLSLIIQGNTAPWTEYINYELAREEQNRCIKAFRSSNFREKPKVNLPLPNPGSNVESNDPVERILRRLSSYDSPKAAPSISSATPILPPLNLTDKEAMFKSLDPFFKTLFQFARDHGVNYSGHTVLDCTYLELVPQLYRTVVQKLKKQITCRGTKETVHCSGPAIIALQIQDARINEHVDHQINTNRAEYESKLSKILQDPAHTLCLSSLAIQHTITVLQNQTQSNPQAREMGVELFYFILACITEETNNYLPTKQLFSECLEKLGQTHVCGVENETPRLLHKILEEPHLGAYLAPHFSPFNVGTANFLHMYATISKSVSQRYDVIFTLLSKFDVTKWLKTQNPKLSQRSQFIELVIKSLTKMGHEPPDESLPLHGVYRKHLLSIFEHQFPEHFGEILMSILKSSNSGNDTTCISTMIWMDVLNFLAQPHVFKLEVPLRDQLRRYAHQQRLLTHQELLETSTLLARHFTQERFQFGLYGLYPKVRIYIDVFILFVGMTGHALIISSLNTHQGMLGEKLCEVIWPFLRDMFAPWVLPYMIQNVKDSMANWIQQLADDRAVLLPWIPADGPFAQRAVHMFFECLQFLVQTLPACNNILSYVWQWYVTNYAHASVKDHILNVIHSSFLALPWHNFWPTVTDLELMLKVVDQYLPECHVFLGCVFIEVSWPTWLNSLSEATPQHIKTRIHQCLLNLLVKLANEPNIRNNHVDKIKALLVQAESFNWFLVDANMFQHTMDWYVQSCDPLVIFKNDPMNLDFRVLHFLKCVSGYEKPLVNNNVETLKKRHIFVRGFAKMISVFTTKHKTLIPSKEKELAGVISSQLLHLEGVVHSMEEFNVLLTSLLDVLNVQSISACSTKCFEQWLTGKTAESLPLISVLQTLSSAVTDLDAASNILEITLNSYFSNNVGDLDAISWKKVCEMVTPFYAKQAEFEQILVTKGCLLTLHGLLLKRIGSCNDLGILMNLVLEWLNNLKISDQSEPKVPLIWSDFIDMGLKYAETNESASGAALYKFSQILLQISEEKEGSKWGRGLLSAIGIVKQTNISLNFKFLCRALAGFLLAQLPDMKGKPQTVRRFGSSPSAVGQPGGNTECPKVLLKLDFGQSQGKIKDYAEIALKDIQNPENSLHSANKFLAFLLTQIYTKPYLKDIG